MKNTMRCGWLVVGCFLGGVLLSCQKDDEATKAAQLQTVTQKTEAIVAAAAERTARAYVSMLNISSWDATSVAFERLMQAMSAMPSLLPNISQESGPVEPTEPGVPGEGSEGEGRPEVPPTPEKRTPGESGPCTPESPCDSGEPVPVPAEDAPADDADAMAAELTDWLSTHIWAQDQAEQVTDTGAVFRIRGENFCAPIQNCVWPEQCTDTCEPTCTEDVDSQCVAMIDGMDARLAVTLVGDDGVDMVLLLGPAQAEVATFSVRPSEASAELNLGAAFDALAAVRDAAAGSGNPTMLDTLPLASLTGVVSAKLVFAAPGDVELINNVVEPVSAEVSFEGNLLSFGVAAASPLAAIHVWNDGDMTATLGLPGIMATMPYAMLAQTESSENLVLNLGGLSAVVGAHDMNGSWDVRDFGFGSTTTTVSLGETPLFALDLNADAGRKLDLQLTGQNDVGSTLSVTPGLELVVDYALGAIASDFPNIEPHFLDATYRFALGGDGVGAVRPVPASETFPGALAVELGTLSLEQTQVDPRLSSAVVVSAGECLFSDGEVAEGDHPLLGHFYSGACE